MIRMTIIRVRRGINGHRYAACREDGTFIQNFDRLSDVRKHWEMEIKWGRVKLIRELDKQADLRKAEEAKKVIEGILETYAMEQRRKEKNGKKERKGNKTDQGPEGADQRRRTGGAQLVGAGGDAGGVTAGEPEIRSETHNKKDQVRKQ